MANNKYLDSDLISWTMTPITVGSLLTRIGSASNNLSLNSKFKRNDNTWDNATKSKLIESTLLRFPVPCFYIDATNNDPWFIIDGLQRLLAFKEFLIDETLTLTELEFYEEYDRKKSTEISSYLRRRIRETELHCYMYLRGTSQSVIPCLYKRINPNRYTFDT